MSLRGFYIWIFLEEIVKMGIVIVRNKIIPDIVQVQQGLRGLGGHRGQEDARGLQVHRVRKDFKGYKDQLDRPVLKVQQEQRVPRGFRAQQARQELMAQLPRQYMHNKENAVTMRLSAH